MTNSHDKVAMFNGTKKTQKTQNCCTPGINLSLQIQTFTRDRCFVYCPLWLVAIKAKWSAYAALLRSTVIGAQFNCIQLSPGHLDNRLVMILMDNTSVIDVPRKHSSNRSRRHCR